MTLDADTERRLIQLVKTHRDPGLSPMEESELRRLLALDNPYVTYLDRSGLIQVARTTIGAQVLMRMLDQVPIPPLPA